VSLTILNLRHYNTPTLEGIVHSSSDTGYQVDRLLNHEHHHRDGYWLGNTSESSPCHRSRSDHNRCGYVRREESLTPVAPGVATQGRGSGENISGASFPIWSTG